MNHATRSTLLARSPREQRRWTGAARLLGCPLLALVLALASARVSALDAEQARSIAADAGQKHSVQARGKSRLDDRIQALSAALDLDAAQRAELRRVLQAQRDQLLRLWSDSTIPAQYRVGATQAIGEKTADQIRSLLTEEQREKYNPPKPPDPARPGAKPDVEAWMNLGQRQ